MKNIYEKSVVKPRDMKDNLITLAAVLGAIALIVLFFMIDFMRQFLFALIVGVGYLAYRIIVGRNLEYEYILVGNSFRMDKIVNKRHRKRILNCDITDFDIVAPVQSKHYEQHKENAVKILNMTSGDNKADEYFGLIEYKEKRTLIMFDTDERAREHLRKYIDYKFKQ